VRQTEPRLSKMTSCTDSEKSRERDVRTSEESQHTVRVVQSRCRDRTNATTTVFNVEGENIRLMSRRWRRTTKHWATTRVTCDLMTRSTSMSTPRFQTVGLRSGRTSEQLVSIGSTGSWCCRLDIETQITSVWSEFKHNRFDRVQLTTRSTQRVTRSLSVSVSPGRQLPSNYESSA